MKKCVGNKVWCLKERFKNLTSSKKIFGITNSTLIPKALENWIEKIWIRPGWLAGHGYKEFIYVAFAAAATLAPLIMVFGCSAIVNTLPYSSALLEESLTFMGSVENQR